MLFQCNSKILILSEILRKPFNVIILSYFILLIKFSITKFIGKTLNEILKLPGFLMQDLLLT